MIREIAGPDKSADLHAICADARIAIEIDGPQHLETTDAYRRDRRKDQLLQENGYFVLRFLAEDVGKNLDMVLDTIQRALFSCRSFRSSAAAGGQS
jgi:very-short-patch-repair endonuclease